MLNKLRANYNLSNILVRIAFVLTFVFCSWQTCLGAVVGMNGMFVSAGMALSGSAKLLLALTTALIMGVILVFLIPVFVNLFLNVSKIYSVLRAEYCLLVHLFCAIGFLICGALNLINLFTPIFLVWGSVLFPFIVTVGCGIAFYNVTVKLYFNDVTVVNYFKHFLITFAIVVLIVEVL